MSRSSSIDVIASAVQAEHIDLRRHSSPAGAVTLLFTDIERSTEILEELGDERWVAILRDHNTIVFQAVQGFSGTIIKSQGDGYMAAYDSSHAALRSAIELQRAFARRRNSPTDPLLRLRIGLHAGSVIADERDYFGRNVVLAARIADLGAGGEILVSSDLMQYTKTDPAFHYTRRGTFELKGLKGKHEVHAVRWDRRQGESTEERGQRVPQAEALRPMSASDRARTGDLRRDRPAL